MGQPANNNISFPIGTFLEVQTSRYKISPQICSISNVGYIVTEFLNEYTIKGDNENTISNTMLRDQYNDWALIRGYKKLTPQTFSSKMRERGHEGTIYKGSRVWHNLILKDIDERTSGGLVVNLKGMETLLGGLGGLNSKSLENKNNNNGNGSCDDAKSENLVKKVEDDTVESVNDEPGEYTLAMKRLSKQDKDKLLDTMKGHYEGSKCVKLTGDNVRAFGKFVHDKYNEYSIHDVMVDAKNKFNLGATA